MQTIEWITRLEQLVSDLVFAAHQTITHEDQNDEDAARAALLAHVTQQDHIRDAPAEVPLPEPIAVVACVVPHLRSISVQALPGRMPQNGALLYDTSPEAYGDAREAAGYARGLKEADRLRDALEQILDDMSEHGLSVCPATKEMAIAALRGEVK